MCSNVEQFQCSVCSDTFSSNENRFIVEVCGHRKCRKCFIAEVDGCSICANNHRSQSPIDQHKNQGNDERRPSQRDKDKSKSVNNAYAHIIIHRDNKGKAITYTCSICQKTFKSRNNQKYHLYCDKNQLKPFQCPQCNKQFITQSHLNYHKKTHRNNKFLCNICNRVFAGENGLRKHSKKHSNERDYTCNVCNQTFLYKEQLNIHVNRHQNKYFQCGECKKLFLVKSNLTKHMLRHSGKY